MFDIDVGGGGGNAGPWVQWHARESLDGSTPSRSFSLRDSNGKENITATFQKGVALDIKSLRTGWNFNSGMKGVPPRWQWNESLQRFADEPPAEGEGAARIRWKRGMGVRVALSSTQSAIWEQSGAAVMAALQALAPALKANAEQIEAGKCPVVKFTGAEKLESKNGMTMWPKFEIAKWVDRPAVFDGAPAPAAKPEPAPAPAPKPAPKKATIDLGDDEF